MLYDFRKVPMQIDAHQHIWTEPLLDALAARSCLPFIRRTEDGLTVLHSANERPYLIDVASECSGERARLVSADGADLAVIAISSPIGIEALPHADAHEIISAHLDGVFALGPPFAAWGPIAVDAPEPADVDEVLARGCVGVSLPASAITGREALELIAPVLDRIQSRGVPLFVHPGGSTTPGAAEASLVEPLWWRALTDYVSQMQAAWLTFAAHGRRELPRLKVLFAMLAGGAPLQNERLEARGGPAIDLHDPLAYYDTSSYGAGIIETVAGWVGPSQLVYGSDRPVIDPVPTGREVELLTNAASLLRVAEVMA